MQIKMTLRFHLTPDRLTSPRKHTANAGEDMGGRGDPHTLLVGMRTSATTMEIRMEVSQKTQTRPAL
jgi:hypothetical protein